MHRHDGERLRLLSETDALTGALNRRGLQQAEQKAGHPVGVGAEAGDDVLAGVGGGGGEQFVVEEHLPVRPDAEPGAAGKLQLDDGAGGGDDLLAFHDRVAGLDDDELALTITQVGFALDKDDGALGGGVDGGVGGGRRAGHAGLRRVLLLGRNLRADARGGYCPRGQVA